MPNPPSIVGLIRGLAVIPVASYELLQSHDRQRERQNRRRSSCCFRWMWPGFVGARSTSQHVVHCRILPTELILRTTVSPGSIGEQHPMGNLILRLSETDTGNSRLTGSKAANLSRVIKTGFKVPDGFVVTTNGYDEMLTKQSLGQAISESLRQIDYGRPETIDACSERIKDCIRKASLSPELAAEVKTHYGQIGGGNVAVRSSLVRRTYPKHRSRASTIHT